MIEQSKNYVSKNAFMMMIVLVIAMSVAVYVRHERNGKNTAIVNYRLNQVEVENKELQRKLYMLEKEITNLQISLDADGDVVPIGGKEGE